MLGSAKIIDNKIDVNDVILELVLEKFNAHLKPNHSLLMIISGNCMKRVKRKKVRKTVSTSEMSIERKP